MGNLVCPIGMIDQNGVCVPINPIKPQPPKGWQPMDDGSESIGKQAKNWIIQQWVANISPQCPFVGIDEKKIYILYGDFVAPPKGFYVVRNPYTGAPFTMPSFVYDSITYFAFIGDAPFENTCLPPTDMTTLLTSATAAGIFNYMYSNNGWLDLITSTGSVVASDATSRQIYHFATDEFGLRNFPDASYSIIAGAVNSTIGGFILGKSNATENFILGAVTSYATTKAWRVIHPKTNTCFV